MYRGPYVGDAPDLVALCASASAWCTSSLRRDLRTRELFGPFTESGLHRHARPAGIYLFAGPRHRRALGRHRDHPIESIAPTALHLLGLPVPRSMEAR